MSESRRPWKGIVFACIPALLWGFLAIALKVAVNRVDPYTIVWFRFLVAFLMLTVGILVFKPDLLRIFVKPPPRVLLAALFLGLNYLGFMQGVRHTSPSNAQVFIQLGPVFFAISGFVIFKEKLRWPQLLGILMVVSGLLIFYRQQLGAIVSERAAYVEGYLWTIGGALSWTVYSILQKKLVRTWHPQQLNLIIYGLPALLFLPFAQPMSLTELSPGFFVFVIALGINTLIAYGSLSAAFSHLEANKISVIITLNPIITFVTMGFLSQARVDWIEPEAFTTTGLAGAFLVLSGAAIAVAFSRVNGKAKENDLRDDKVA